MNTYSININELIHTMTEEYQGLIEQSPENAEEYNFFYICAINTSQRPVILENPVFDFELCELNGAWMEEILAGSESDKNDKAEDHDSFKKAFAHAFFLMSLKASRPGITIHKFSSKVRLTKEEVEERVAAMSPEMLEESRFEMVASSNILKASK